MDNRHFMLKVSRLFPSSFTSCQFRNLSDVAETSIPINKLHLSSSLSLQTPSKSHSPKPPHKTSLNLSSTSNASCFTTSDDVDTDTFFSISSNSGDSFRLPTATSKRFRTRDEMKSIDETARCSFSSTASFNKNAATETNGGGGGGSGGGRKPSRTTCVELGSDHVSTQLYYNGNGFRRRRGGGNRRRITKKSGGGFGPGCGAVVGDSYAVEKRSRDPRGDFRASMVEMIVEKRLFAAEDLERLLRCFLSLNSTSYHGMIFDVFSEICQTLFTN